ncbi:TonB-linked SusC/RagA family outer membrane protein [Chitinophaga polysaccharea]|uniref:TonB-linked SusC/RagA family outer membrane protein n=1 Tax=Chitinophaga polysaccharea TaxID=1293035 RepID=A0A561PNN3_9BACT|nr:TonB-dependent receptor [Chitinophaga polysaccharea]TWF39732.1 TonB-linked SusC/RagA family outer membrane protein [Chitinophaga polysaccharea]
MKKIYAQWRVPPGSTFATKLVKTMKLTALLLFTAMMGIAATGRSQDNHLTIRLSQGSLPQLFSQIQSQSTWRIFYKDELVNKEQPITLELRDKKLTEVLDQALANTALSYRIVRNQVAIIPREKGKRTDKINGISTEEDSTYLIRGRVYDNHEPPQALPGVTIRVKDNNNIGTTSDVDGYFTLRAKKNAVIVFTQMGYLPEEHTVIRSHNALNISLKEKVAALDEVVVVGLSEQQKKHIASSISSVNIAQQTNGKPITALSQALQGGVTGLQVSQSSGLPGGDAAVIKIRGLSTLSPDRANPLVLVDGVPMDMNYIDPVTVESVTILKDAAAAAVYGARGANGVILVTTKRGVAGRVAVTYDGYYGVQTPSTMPKLVEAPEYMRMFNEAQVNAGNQPFYSDDDIKHTEAGDDPIKYPNTNWQKEIINPAAAITSHSLGISGGNSLARFALTANYQFQDGMIPLNHSNKYNVRANTSITLSKKFLVYMDMLAIKRNTFYPNRPNGNSGNRILEDIFRVPPTILPKYPEKDGAPTMYGRYVDIVNPVAYAEHGGKSTNEYGQSSINLQPKWEVLPGLNLRGQFSFRLNSDVTRNTRDNYYFFDYFSGQLVQTWGVSRSASFDRTTYYYAGVTADYTYDLKDHHFYVMGGYSQEENNSSYWEVRSLLSFYGKLNYSYKDKYLLEGAIRTDGSSRFGPGHKFGTFPSVALGWNVHKENFMQSLRAINSLKLRASYGRLGNENVDLYQYQSMISANDGVESVFGNPDITWETVDMLDLGVDMSLFKGKLEFTFDYYDKRTNGIILNPPVSYVGGMGTTPINAGKLRNKGIELSLNYNSNIGKNVTLSVRPGISYNNNELLSLRGGPYISGGTIHKEGYALGSLYGYKTNGLLQAGDFKADGTPLVPIIANEKPGDIHYVDVNGDNVIDGKDQTVIGNPTPKVDYFANIRLTYKKWELEMLLQGVSKDDAILAGMLAYPLDMSFDGGVPTRYYADNYWTPQRTDARFPRLTTSPSINKLNSDFWIQNGAYARIKYIQLGYNFNSERLKRVGINGARIYVNAQNPFVFTSMKLVDPESQGNQWTYGIMKMYTAGVSIQL